MIIESMEDMTGREAEIALRAYTGHTDRSAGRAIELTLRAIVQMNAETVAETKGELPMWGGVLLERGEDGGKVTKIPISFTAVMGDHDAGTISVKTAGAMLDAAGVAGAILETASSTPEHPRWRAVIPMSGPLSADEHREMVSKLNTALEGSLAPESWSTKQGYYYGHIKGSRTPESVMVVGATLDLLKIRGTPCLLAPNRSLGDTAASARSVADEFDIVEAQGGVIPGTERPSNERVATTALKTGENLHSGILAATHLVAIGEWPEQFTLDAFTVAATATRGPARAANIAHEWRKALEGAEKYISRAQRERITALGGAVAFHRVDSPFEKFKPIEWAVDGFLAWGITVIAGAPGVGKTSQIVSLAMLVAHLCGENHEMRPVLRRRVIYVTEDAQQVESILVAACKLNGVAPHLVRGQFLVYEARRLDPKTAAATVAQLIAQNTMVHASGFPLRPLTVLDTSSSIFELEDENSNSAAAGMIAEVKQVLQGAPLWLVAHTPKSLSRADVESLTVRGAGAFEGDANATAFCFKEEGVEDKRFMRLGKVRYDPDYRELMFTSEVHSEVVETPWGGSQTIRARVSYPERSSKEERDSHKKAAKTAAKEESNQGLIDAILAFLESHGPASKTTIKHSVTGKNEAVGAAVTSLVASGVLEIVGSGPKQVVQMSNQTM